MANAQTLPRAKKARRPEFGRDLARLSIHPNGPALAREALARIGVKDSDSIQHAGNVQLDAVTTKLHSFGTIVEAIFAEGADYMKKSVAAWPS